MAFGVLVGVCAGWVMYLGSLESIIALFEGVQSVDVP